jgi:hypothetical protein
MFRLIFNQIMKIKITLLSFLFLITGFFTRANDLCVNAVTLIPNLTCTSISSSFAGATISTPLPTCAPGASQDVWFKFTATDSTNNIFLGNVSGVNHGFEVITDSCNGTILTCVNNNGAGSGESYFSAAFGIGRTYYIRVFNASSNILSSSFSICVQKYPAPSNNECANAITLTPNINCVTTQGSFSGASFSGSVAVCMPNSSQDVWFKFVATDSTHSIFLGSASGLNHGMELIADSCNGAVLECINSNVAGTSESYFNNNFWVGRTYYIRVLNVGVLSIANFSICVQKYPAPSNNECASAITLTPNINCVTTQGSFSGASFSGSVAACMPNSSQDVWFKFVATDSTHSIFLGSTSGLNHGMELIADSCNGAVLECINSNVAGTSESYFNNNFWVGRTYYIRVLNVGVLSIANFSICVQKYPAPSNNECASAITLTPNINCVTTQGSFSGASFSGSVAACMPNSSQDVWFKFVATDSTHSIFLGSTSGLNHGMELIADSCNGAVLECINSNVAGTSESYFNNNFWVGRTYYIRVLNVGVLSIANFSICVQKYPAPSNNECASALLITAGTSCNTTSISFSGSSFSGSLPTCGLNSSQDIWCKFIATNSTLTIFASSASGLNHGIQVFADSCNGQLISCTNNNGTGTSETNIYSSYVVGNTYYVRLFNVNASLSVSTIGICVYGNTLQCVPVVNIVANTTSICSGASVIFSASAINGGTSPVYQWKLNGINVGTNSNIYTTNSLLNNDVITCILTSNSTCTLVPSDTSNAITITVSTAIAPSITINQNTSTLCNGSTIQYTAITNNVGTTPTYNWYMNNVNQNINASSFSTNNYTGPVYCVVISSNSCASPSSATSNTITTSVLPLVVPSISINSNQNPICAGNTASFTSTTNNGGNNPIFQWYVNNNLVGSGNALPNYLFQNNDQVYCVFTSSNPCASPTSVTSNTVIMQVQNSTIPFVTITSSANSICAGSTVTFTASASNAGLLPTYVWYINGAVTGGTSTSYISSSLNNNDLVTCSVTSSNACANPSVVTSNSIIMQVQNSVVPSINISATDTSICNGLNVTFTASAINGGTSPIYQWKVNGINVGSNSATYSTSSLNNNDAVQCELTSSALCAVPNIIISNIIIMNVSTNVMPSISLSTNNSSICAGDSVIINASTTFGGNNPNYLWFNNGVSLSNNSNVYITNSLVGSNNIYAVLVSNEPCVFSNIDTSNTISITVQPIIAPVFNLLPNAICKNDILVLPAISDNGINGSWSPAVNTNTTTTYTFTPSNNCSSTYTATVLVNNNPVLTLVDNNGVLSVNNGFAIYEWSIGGNIVVGAFTNTYTPTQTGLYEVKVVDVNGCTSSASIIVDKLLSTKNISKHEIQIFPNPVTHNVSLKTTPNLIGNQFEILDLNGRVLVKHKLESENIILPITLPDGVYVIYFPVNNIRKKFVVKRKI